MLTEFVVDLPFVEWFSSFTELYHKHRLVPHRSRQGYWRSLPAIGATGFSFYNLLDRFNVHESTRKTTAVI